MWLPAGLVFFTLLVQLTSTTFGESSDDLHWHKLTTSYPRYNETTTLLQGFESQFPDLVKIYSVGKAVSGKEMWVIQMARNVTSERPLLRPMVKIVANMHGDETLGRQLTLLLTSFILQEYKKNNPRILQLLNSTDLHLMPSMNPDGYEAAAEGVCDPNPSNIGRQNENHVDLNRNFPDQFVINKTDDAGMVAKREPETLNVMKWIVENPFVLSANLHAGSLVASYPYDSVPPEVEKRPDYRGSGVPSVSYDDDAFKYLATLFSQAHKTMHDSNNCGDNFPGGITNGAEWYNVRGGMQDFNYVHSNCFEITLELSCCKFLPANKILEEWENNREAFLQYIEAGNMGAQGVVLDENENPIEGAKIEVKSIAHSVATTKRGEYWRLLAPGHYQIRATAPRYKDSNWTDIHVESSSKPVLFNFKLEAGELGTSKASAKAPGNYLGVLLLSWGCGIYSLSLLRF